MKALLLSLSILVFVGTFAQKEQTIRYSYLWDVNDVYLNDEAIDTSKTSYNYSSDNRSIELVVTPCSVSQLRFEKEGYRTGYRLLRPNYVKPKKKRKDDCENWNYRSFTNHDQELVKTFQFEDFSFNVVLDEFEFDYQLKTTEISPDAVWNKEIYEEEEDFRMAGGEQFSDRYSIEFCRNEITRELGENEDNSPAYKLSANVKGIKQRLDLRTGFTSQEINLLVQWKLLNEDGVIVSERWIESESGDYLSSSNSLDEDFNFCLSNALLNSLHSFFSEKEELYQALEEELKWEAIPLTEAKTTVSSLTEATNALVSISFGEDLRTTGVFVANDGYILTSAFFYNEDSVMTVTTNDKRQHSAELIRKSTVVDVMLIKIDTLSNEFLEIPSKKEFTMAENVFAISNPMQELGQSLSKGIISGVRALDGIKFIQSDVRISPESIGGALVSEDGTKFYGMISDKSVGFGVEGIVFILQADFIREVLKLQ